jgi:hypothetical protein
VKLNHELSDVNRLHASKCADYDTVASRLTEATKSSEAAILKLTSEVKALEVRLVSLNEDLAKKSVGMEADAVALAELRAVVSTLETELASERKNVSSKELDNVNVSALVPLPPLPFLFLFLSLSLYFSLSLSLSVSTSITLSVCLTHTHTHSISLSSILL